MPFSIVRLPCGLATLRCEEHEETFHPVIGPLPEAVALHVRQQRLAERAAQSSRFVIYDVGFGAAANAIAAIQALASTGACVEIHSYDRSMAAIEFALAHAAELDYLSGYASLVGALLKTGVQQVPARGVLTWHLHVGDFAERVKQPSEPAPDAILFDPYSPESNPEIWNLEFFRALYARLDPARACLLTNYTRSTAIRTTLLLAGFCVGRGVGIGEKEETTIASNELGLLERPLDHAWLNRVRASTRGAPRRLAEAPGRIDDADWARLLGHRQFAGATGSVRSCVG